jgi:hypothetical protein
MTDMISSDVFLMLVLAHLLGDFVLQTDSMVASKRKLRLIAHFAHAALHTVLAYMLLGLWQLWLVPLVIGLAHGGLDLIKECVARRFDSHNAEPSPRRHRAVIFLTDQALHLTVIALVVLVLIDPAAAPAWVEWFGETAAIAAIALIGLIATIWVGAVVVGFSIEPYLSHLRAATHNDDLATAGDGRSSATADTERGFPRGGRIIGQLERALVFLFVITGNMTGVGFLVAAKSVFRFGEIREPHQREEAEYIIIGTLMSFTWAIFVAWLTRWAIDLV